LHDVFGDRRVADQPAREVIGCVEMGKYNPFEIVKAILFLH
jgi:hypothetical protein